MTLRRRTVDVDLPAHLSRRCEKQFRHLVNQLSSQGFAGRYLRDEVFSKYLDDSLVAPGVRASAAVEKFIAAEARNAKTNLRLVLAAAGACNDLGWTEFDTLISTARNLIARVLGPLRYPEVLSGTTFTNGASTSVRRGPAAAIHKLTGEVHVTETAIKHWLAMASGTRLSRLPLRIAESSVLFTVPKKTEIDRVACKEPSGNALLQRAVGVTLRHRLRRVGINLHDQTRNQDAARRGLEDGLATIDLSSASDTVSQEIVRLLLPFDWWSLLSDLRVQSTILPDGTVLELEMFSSMGNGFTFELETLIFWALAKATSKLSGLDTRSILVYGDDIIVPCNMARRLLRVLSLMGFMPNAKKTHVSGRFRESCGRHYYDGLDVTPFYLRRGIATVPELINLLNHLLEWDGRGFGCFTTPEAFEFWKRWSEYVPKFLWGGIDPADPTCLVTGHPPRKRLVPVTKRVRFSSAAALLLWLHRRDSAPHVSSHEDPLALDPRDTLGWKAERVVSCGERTTWRPDLAFA